MKATVNSLAGLFAFDLLKLSTSDHEDLAPLLEDSYNVVSLHTDDLVYIDGISHTIVTLLLPLSH